MTEIDKKAFAGCSKLKKVTLKSKIKKIGASAFYKCKNLKTIRIYTTMLTKDKVGKNAFKSIHKKATFYVPKKKLKSYKSILLKRGATKKMKYKAIK